MIFPVANWELEKNLSMEIFTQRYRQFSSPLAYIGHSHRNADFSDWQLWLHPDVMNALSDTSGTAPVQYSVDVRELQHIALLCCPEDHRCVKDCVSNVSKKLLCASCQLPVCRHCQIALQKNEIVEIGLCNDNWYGYVDRWIYENNVTWMEKTCATPFWTGIMLFCIDPRHSRRKKHLLENPLFKHGGRTPNIWITT